MGMETAIIASAVIGAGASALNKADKPKDAPKAPPPVSSEDPNVKQAANMKKRQMAAASRASARKVTQYGSTLG